MSVSMLAVQENLLAGTTPMERFTRAKALGFQAVEVWASDLHDDSIMDYAQAIDGTELPISALYMGNLDGFLSPDVDTRYRAIDRFRQTLADAHDLRIPYVLVVPQINRAGESVTVSPAQEKEMLIWFVRVVNDLAGAMNTQMCLLPLDTTQSRSLNRLQQAYDYLAEMNFHPAVRLAADLYSMNQADDATSLATLMPMLAYIHVHACADRSASLHPPTVKDWLTQIRGAGFNGTYSLACGMPSTQPIAALDEAILTETVAQARGLQLLS